MTRRRFTKAQREAFLVHHDYRCHLCGGEIFPADIWDIEHMNQLWMSGDNSDDNLRPAHRACHMEKSKKDAAARGKVRHIIKANDPAIRAAKPKTIKSRPFPKVSRPFPKRRFV